MNAGFSRSRSETHSHTESAAVSTITGKDADSTITYSNVGNITYQGTQAKDTGAVYNNVETITKEAVELNNRYSSSGSSFGINAGATIGYGHRIQTTGNGGSVSFGRGSQNTNETVYHNGSFANVNEVHNNTGTMTVSGFNQEGGKVTGNINNLIVESRQNTSTTTGGSIGFTAGNIPLSNIGFNQETNDRRGTARNTVTGNVNIHNAAGDAVNRDILRANETTEDTHSRTNINVESQTIQYIANPGKLKEDLNKAGQG